MNEGNKDVREALRRVNELLTEAAEQLAAVGPEAFSDEEHFWFVSRRIAEAGKVVAGEERRHS